MLVYDKGHPTTPPPEPSQSIWYRFHIEAMELASRGTSVIEGMAVNPGSGLSVGVTAGTCEIDGSTLDNPTTSTVSGISSDSSHPRWALIYGTKSGNSVTISARMGSPGTAHYPPYLNLGTEVPIALVYIDAGATSISTSDIQSAAIVSRRVVNRVFDSDFSISNNTTLTDTGLVSPTMAAGEVWYLNGYLRVDTTASGGWKIGWDDPGQADGWWSTASEGSFLQRHLWTENFSSVSFDGADVVEVKGIYPCTSSGQVELQFAQHASSGTAASIKASSVIKWEKVA